MRDLGPASIAMFAANLAFWAGLGATALGLALVVAGLPFAWLGWSGAVLTISAIAARYALVRKMTPILDRIAKEGLTTIYKPLLNEGVEVRRPVEAMKIGELGYMVTENPPSDEEWAFQPGQILRCEQRSESGEILKVAAGYRA